MSPLRRSFLPLAAALCMALLLGACGPGGHGGGMSFGGLKSIFEADLSARQPDERGGRTAAAPGQRGNVATLGVGERVYSGGPAAGDAPGQTASSFEPGEFNLNFQNADIREVVQSILGNALGENYTIDTSVGGTVSMSSARPLSRDQLLPALETVLQTLGAVLVHTGDLYRVTIEASAIASSVDYGDATPGYGISIIPLQHTSARTMISLIEGFGVRPGAVRAIAASNMLVVLGTGNDRKTAVDTALNFDVDWMENQSVAILPLSRAKPEVVIPELERIFRSREGGAGADLVQFMPMQRLKAVLVVSSRRELLERARTWAKRLDTDNPDLESDVYVYRVKYRDAEKIADLLNRIFTGGGSTLSSSASAQVEPGAAPVATQGQGSDFGFGQGPGGAGRDQQSDIIAGGDSGRSDQGGPPALGGPAASAPVTSDTGGGGGSATVRIQADTANNSIVIYADLETRQQILGALQSIDVPQLQVAINVTMAEIRLNDQLRYGIQYFIRSNTVGAGKDKGSAGLFNGLVSTIARDLPGFNFVIGSEASPDVIINAFRDITDVQVLSSPSLVVVENQTAKFQVGDQIPIVTRTVTSVTDSQAPVSNEVEYRDTGVILKIKPRIAENGVVNLDIAQEISNVASGSSTLTPTISNRKVESTISVVDGQTVLLGGLIGEQTTKGHTGIPGLSRIPGIGNLFGSRNNTGSRTELIILIRPSVIRGSEDAEHVAEELRARMWRAQQAN